MTFDWLNDLSAKAKAATPGEWELEKGEGFYEGDVFITSDERDGKVEIAKIEYGSSIAGMDEPFQLEQAANAAFIAAANPQTVQRLIGMIRKLEGNGLVEATENTATRYPWLGALAAAHLSRALNPLTRSMSRGRGEEHMHCPCCGGSGHVGDCDKALVKMASERDELKSRVKKLEKEKTWLCDMCEYFCNAMPEGKQCTECPALRYCKQYSGVDWSTASSKAVMSAYEQICFWARGNV